MRSIDTTKYKSIVVLTGAGISKGSGLRTYRGEDGLWNNKSVERLSHVEMLEHDADEAWRFFSWMRETMKSAEPNAAHLALATWQKRLQDNSKKFCLITQNIDGLHTRAGSENVVEMHGGVFRTRCNNADCPKSTPIADDSQHEAAPLCSACDSILRPDVVLFGELIPAEADWQTRRALRDCDLFLAIGTSGTVFPACDFVRAAKYAGAHTILINPEEVPAQSAFDQHICAKAEESLPELLK